MMFKKIRMTLVLTLCFALMACGDDEGSAPTITSLSVDSTTIPVGMQTQLSATLGFTDPDGDLVDTLVKLDLPGGQRQDLGSVPIQGASGLTEGNATLTLVVNPPVEGTYVFDVQLRDEEGLTSDPVQQSVTAE